jgi:hypothetical protein
LNAKREGMLAKDKGLLDKLGIDDSILDQLPLES